MIFGAADKETVQLNEDSLWEGDEKDSGMYQNLGEFEVALPRAKPVDELPARTRYQPGGAHGELYQRRRDFSP